MKHKIAVIHGGDISGYLRVTHPFEYAEDSLLGGNDFEYIPMIGFPARETWNDYYAFIIQRPLFNCFSTIESIKKLNKPVIIDLDDKFPVNAEHHQNDLYGNISPIVRELYKCIEICDGLTVSTNALYEFYQSKFKRKFIQNIPNVLSTEHITKFPLSHIDKDKFNILWVGTDSHFDNFQLVKPHVEDFLEDYPNAHLTMISPLTVKDIIKKSSLEKQITCFEFIPLQDYLGIHYQFDVCIVPLVKNDFNDCKSEIKILEAARHSVPVIVSKHPAYDNFLHKCGSSYFKQIPNDLEKQYQWYTRLRDAYHYGHSLNGMIAYKVLRDDYNMQHWNNVRHNFVNFCVRRFYESIG